MTLDTRRGFQFLLGGIILAVVLGLLAGSYEWPRTWLHWVLVLGVVVGVANMFHEEAILFLLSTITFTFMISLFLMLQVLPKLGMSISVVVLCLVAPAAIVVSLKTMYALATK